MRIVFAFVLASLAAYGGLDKRYCKVAKNGASVEYAPDHLWPDLAKPTEAQYLAAGWLKNAVRGAPASNGCHVASVRYEARDGRVVAVYGYEPDTPVARRWTPLSIKRSAVRLGRWDDLRSLLVAADAYDDFVMAQYEAEDDPDFVRLMAAARERLGGATVDAVLDGAEVEP